MPCCDPALKRDICQIQTLFLDWPSALRLCWASVRVKQMPFHWLDLYLFVDGLAKRTKSIPDHILTYKTLKKSLQQTPKHRSLKKSCIIFFPHYLKNLFFLWFRQGLKKWFSQDYSGSRISTVCHMDIYSYRGTYRL